MNNILELSVRSFPVVIVDERTGEKTTDNVVLTRAQLQAAQLVGQSSKELIVRLYARKGYRVTGIGKPTRRTVTVDVYETGGEIVVEGYDRTDGKVVELD